MTAEVVIEVGVRITQATDTATSAAGFQLEAAIRDAVANTPGCAVTSYATATSHIDRADRLANRPRHDTRYHGDFPRTPAEAAARNAEDDHYDHTPTYATTSLGLACEVCGRPSDGAWCPHCEQDGLL